MIVSNKIICCVLLGIAELIISTVGTLSQVLHTGNSYRAAVVEYHPVKYPSGTPADKILMDNVNRYTKIINENKNLDIIVFPELTLTKGCVKKKRLDILNYSTPVPNPSEAIDVCESHNQFPQFFTRLACAAKDAEVYVVVNLIEQKLCYSKSYYGEYWQCSKDSWNFYNTDVVFDRNGRVVGRYRKYHLFGETWVNRTLTPDIAIFKTDFGIKFGMFTCFDILFGQPAVDLVKFYGVSNIIYPTMWYSELPFLTALQMQMQWAYELNTVLLAAGANDCPRGSGGTGIFQGRSGAVILDYPINEESKVYVGNVSKIMTEEADSFYNENDIDDMGRKMDDFYLMTEDLSRYTIQMLDPLEKVVKIILCENQNRNKLCCHFYIKMEVDDNIKSDKQHYKYHMVIYKGVRSFKGIAYGGLEVCGVIACMGNTSKSCGHRFPNYDDIAWPVTFTEISIKANFSIQNTKIQYPNTLLSSIRPLPVDSFEWKHMIYSNTIIERTLTLKKSQNRLLTFGIYGRDFSKDTIS